MKDQPDSEPNREMAPIPAAENGRIVVSSTTDSTVQRKSELPQPIDYFRDTYIRYLGYANEVGEAFRSFIRVSIVRASYGVASTYVLADAGHKGSLSYEKFKSRPECSRLVTQSVVDTVIWQGLASVIIPGFTINRLCWFSSKVLSPVLPSTSCRTATTAIGLLAIPFIVKPIDRSVDALMNNTYRVWFNHQEVLGDQVHHTRDD